MISTSSSSAAAAATTSSPLSLQSNSLSGAFPSLANLSSLQEVYLDMNNFTSIPAGCFTGLSSLQILSMSQNINLDEPEHQSRLLGFPSELTEASSLVTFAAGFWRVWIWGNGVQGLHESFVQNIQYTRMKERLIFAVRRICQSLLQVQFGDFGPGASRHLEKAQGKYFNQVLKGSFKVFLNAGQEKNVMSPKNSEVQMNKRNIKAKKSRQVTITNNEEDGNATGLNRQSSFKLESNRGCTSQLEWQMKS